MQPIDCCWEENVQAGRRSRDGGSTRMMGRKGRVDAIYGATPIPAQFLSLLAQLTTSKSATGCPRLRYFGPHGLVLLLLLPLFLSSSAAGQGAPNAAAIQHPPLSDPQIEASLDPEPVDGSTDEANGEYGQWEGGGKGGTIGQMDKQRRPMEFIRKFSWERRGAEKANLRLEGPTGEEEGWRRGERKKRPADMEYDEILAARLVAEEDVDRLRPAEGGDRPNNGKRGRGHFGTQKVTNSPQKLLMTSFPPSSSSSSSSPYSSPSPLPPSSSLPFSRSLKPLLPPNWPKLPEGPSIQMVKPSEGGGTVALGELDLKSDGELAKMMRRTTLRTREYPVERTMPGTTTTTPLPSLLALAPSQAPSIFALPGLLFPQQSPPNGGGIPSSVGTFQNSHQSRRGLRPEQFEQLGCGWDFMSQSCKDVFRFGWCQNCVDFGNPFLHDCRCTAVTGLYVQTATFLGSSAASARANAAVTAVNNNQSHSYLSGGVPILPALPLLPTLEQLAAPLELAGHGAPPSTPSSSFLAQTVTTPASQVVQALADAFRLPQTPMPLLSVAPSASQGQNAQQQQSVAGIPLAVPPLLGPPARAFGQFVPPPNATPIVPQFVSQGARAKRN